CFSSHGGDGYVSEGYETASETEAVDDDNDESVSVNKTENLNDVIIKDQQKPLKEEQVSVESKEDYGHRRGYNLSIRSK
nr:hypothetical protein [Tanacetum cinerariifolium]